jgi:hypothetical protein
MSSFSWGQTKKPRTLDEVVAHTGADRQQILVDGAKAEGKVVWYTSLSGVYRELVDAFKRRYPDIAVEVYRGGSTDLGPRLLNEAQAGRYVADALESTPGLLMLLRERRLLKPYTSPELGRYPDEARPKPTARASTGSPIEKPTLDSATTLDKLRRRKFRKAFKIS